MRDIHMPVWLGASSVSRAVVFSTLFFMEAFARTVLLAVIPLQALRLMGDAQQVSTVYFVAGLIGVLASLTIPWLVRRIRRRTVLSFGILSMIFSAVMFGMQEPAALVVGLAFQAFATTSIAITLNLYVMDHIARREMNRFEPFRMFLSASAWAIGPWLGVWLAVNASQYAAFGVSAGASLVMLAFFWFLRITDNPAVASAPLRSPNPLRYLPRFFAQPRLRLSWFLAFGRSAWWQLFFVYAPIYAVSNGFDEVAGGAIVSIGSLSLYLVPLWGWVGRRFGLRMLLIIGFASAGILTMAIALTSGLPWVGAALIVGAALGASLVDGGGNVPFLRAVRPFERAEMPTVFMTYRNASQFGPPGIYAFLLRSYELPAVFLAGGIMTLSMAALSGFIHRRM